MLKKIALGFLLCLILVFLFLGKTLFQEGNPIPILTAIIKLEISNKDYVTISNGTFISENTGENRFNPTIDMMELQGWVYIEQIGSSLLFEKDGEQTLVETRQFSNQYIIWNIPINKEANQKHSF